MKQTILFCQRLFTVSLFSLMFFSAEAQAQKPQAFEVDEQIMRKMLAYVGEVEAASKKSRPRISYQNTPADRNDDSRTIAESEFGGSSSAFALEKRAFDLVNGQRLRKGLPQLKWSEEMARVARYHSANMARHKFFSHQGRDGSSVNERAQSIGARTWWSIGENIAFNKGFKNPVEMACQHWMASTGHRQNILDRGWTESGIGVAVAPDGSYYFTQVFVSR